MKTEIDELTLGQCREIAAQFGKATSPVNLPHPYEVEENYFIRTVTHHLVGELVAVYPNELVITKAAWIPSDGRFQQAIESGKFDEQEPFPDKAEVIVNRASIIDCVKIGVKLPLSQK